MDYQTKPSSRKQLRALSKVFRRLFDVDFHSPFPVLEALEKIPDVFRGTTVHILGNHALPPNNPARCFLDEDNDFHIEIKEKVYNSAYNGQGGARSFICHEMCHVFLYRVGFTPVMNRSFANNTLPAYCSVEWQTKALCGEVMMPYADTRGMPEWMIMKAFLVSRDSARMRKKYH